MINQMRTRPDSRQGAAARNWRGEFMYYLYGIKPGQNPTLVATFDSEQQLLAYVGWATLHENPDHTYKFEQGSALAACNGFESSSQPLDDDSHDDVPHNPSPSML